MSAPLIGSSWQMQLMDMEEGWDTYGAPKISREAIRTIEHFATVPTSDGGIQLEIHRDGFDIEIEIGPDGKIDNVLLCRGAGQNEP